MAKLWIAGMHNNPGMYDDQEGVGWDQLVSGRPLWGGGGVLTIKSIHAWGCLQGPRPAVKHGATKSYIFLTLLVEVAAPRDTITRPRRERKR